VFNVIFNPTIEAMFRVKLALLIVLLIV